MNRLFAGKRLLALVLAICFCISLAACGITSTDNGKPSNDEGSSTMPGTGHARAVALASYPEMAPYPDESEYIKPNGEIKDSFNEAYKAWSASIRVQREQPEGYADGLDGFFGSSIREFLKDVENSNRVYSPLNVYMALAMLSEVTDGQSRAQLLDLLGADSIETVREQARALWNANYRDDGLVTSVLASSLWLNERINFIQSTMDTLAENYHASAFSGKMGSAEYDKMLQDWINDQTGNLLEEQASGLQMDPRTIMALATTIYFKAPWSEEFGEQNTGPGLFEAPEGTVKTDFMHRKAAEDYYWGERFAAVGKYLESGGAMWFLLPDEGISPEELIADDEAMEFMLLKDKYSWDNRKHLIVNLAVPKFDVSSDVDLISGLETLGVRDVFDYTISDFTPMTTDEDEIYVSSAEHAARVTIDEKGCTGAAYTVIMMKAGAAEPPNETVDFIVDRPFVFVITGADGLPLFVGIVNDPTDAN